MKTTQSVTTSFDTTSFNITKYDKILRRGLSVGLGKRGGQMCIEAAICSTLGLPHGDDPQCVAESVRMYKIRLNDASWSSPKARAMGLRDLGLAQLGSKGVVNDKQFSTMMSEQTIRVLVPTLFRELRPNNKAWLEAATRCERNGTAAAAYDAAAAAHAHVDAAAAAYDAAAHPAHAAHIAAAAAHAHAAHDKYLLLSARLALDVLKGLGSPGCKLL